MTEFTCKNDYLEMLINTDEITEDIEDIMTKVLNSRYFLKVDNKIYCYEGLLFEDATITKNEDTNTVTIKKDIYTIIIKDIDYFIEDSTIPKDIDKLFEVYNILFSIDVQIDNDFYTFSPENNKIIFKKMSNKEYLYTFDLAYFIYDITLYYIATLGSKNAVKDIIDNEIITIYRIKRELEDKINIITNVYVELNSIN